MPDNEMLFNGVRGDNGQYLKSPMELKEAIDRASEKGENFTEKGWITAAWESLNKPHFGLPFSISEDKPEQAGWGIIYHKEDRPAVVALVPLIKHRHRLYGWRKVRILEYKSGQDYSTWLNSYKAGAANYNLDQVPYYLLIVGSPERISFDFSQHLSLLYAVGRLHFDSLNDYRRYAQSVIDYETFSTLSTTRKVIFFAPNHDISTQSCVNYLVTPLAQGLPENFPDRSHRNIAEACGFQSELLPAKSTTKETLLRILRAESGEKPPAFLFTASHGVAWPFNEPNQQLRRQGSILCQDWPGPGAISTDHYLMGENISNQACLHGMIIFCFACYSAGTPSHDRYFHRVADEERIASKPFISSLAKALLAHSNGGALAFIGHIDRAWGYSFLMPHVGAQTAAFSEACYRIMKGDPVGMATRRFHENYGIYSHRLSVCREEVSRGNLDAASDLARLWTQRNDAEGYLIIGDPAVRLRTSAA